MAEIKFTVNGVNVIADENDTILTAAQKFGVEIPNLCHNKSVKVYGACSLCVVEAQGVPKLLRACSAKPTEGMVVNSESPRAVQSRKVALELLMSDHIGDCKGPCSLNCPAGTDVQGYVKLIAEGKYHEAVAKVKEKFPFPASIGRVCPHPCEDKCRRQHVDQPVSIAFLKSFAGDYDLKADTYRPEKKSPTGKKVGIIGGGPAGLTAAYFLAIAGHQVKVFDAMPKMGGMLRYGIPEYRLPKAVLQKEIDLIADLGVEMINDFKIGRDIAFDEFCKSFDAVLVAIGAWTSSKMRVPGEDISGVLGGIDFLREVSLGNVPNIGDRVAVVGGGNTAMDACRTAVRVGAKEVYVIYRRTRSEMPAAEVEIEEAEQEGVVFKFLTNPAEFVGENGKLKGVKLQVMELGEPDSGGRRRPVPVEGKFEYIELDTAVMAIGQYVDTQGFESLEVNKRGIIAADENTFATNIEGVFAVGDATNRGAGIAIAAIGEANKAAAVINSYLEGKTIPYKAPFVSEKSLDDIDFEQYKKEDRAKMPGLAADERKHNFNEIYFGFSEQTAQKEANRCLECGCHDYDNCKLIKYANLYDLDVKRFDGEKHHRLTENSLCVIERNPEKCILCGQCVRVCNEVAGKGILAIMGRGFDSIIKSEFGEMDIEKICGDCKMCAYACPTGALKIIK